MSNEINSLYRFGDFKFDCRKGKLWRNNELLLLSPKATELLNLLLERNGEFVSKDEIFEKVWADTFVEDGVLTQNIYTLRKVLGNDSDGLPIIENKTRLGYRLTIPILIQEEVKGRKGEGEKVEKSSFTQSPNHPITQSRRKVIVPILIVVLAVGFFTALYFRHKISAFFRKPIENVKFTGVTKSGDVANSVLSPDGNFVATIRGNNVFLTDINIEKDIKLDIPNVDSFSSLQFSPDGNFLYFRNNKIQNTIAKIFKVSRFGGEKELIAEQTWGSFSLSPDGKKIAHFRLEADAGKINLIIVNLENKEEKEFTATEPPTSNCGNCSPAWSPDGSKVIFTVNTPAATNQLFLLNLGTEKIEEIKPQKLRRFEQAAWFPDGESFLVSASDGSSFLHLWRVFYPNLDVQPMTNGLTNYGKISISADGKKVLAMQTQTNSNIYLANAENLNEQKQLTFGKQNNFGQNALNWINDQKIVYSVQTEQNVVENLSVIDTVENTKSQISNETESPLRFPTSDGKYIYFNANKNGFSGIFQMTIDGKNLKTLINEKDGQRQSPRISNDGKFVYYTFRSKDLSQIRRFDVQNQKEEVFFDNPEYRVSPFMELSPDNKFITFLRISERVNIDPKFDKYNAAVTILSTENITDIKWFPVSMILPFRRFSPDSKAVNYILADSDGTQIVQQLFDGSEPKPILTISDGRIFNFAWSKDGKKIALSRGQQFSDAVLLSDFDK